MLSEQQNATKVLLSIKPEFANRIFSGEKRYEYRRAIFRRKDVKVVVVYASSPVCRVIGEFEITHIHEGTPDSIWQNTADYSGISRDRYRSYFSDKELGYAIEIGQHTLYSEPRNLQDAFGISRPPQSFAYLH
ncbi:MAG: ASCH domain-containing protein [Chloroflexi bacterium]|nr:ASCH domain-containing protein [Chloroflexota bacterium]